MPFVIFAAPIFNENAIRFIGATADLPQVQLAVISQEPQEKLPPELRARLVGHWQVDNALDSGRLLWAAQSLAQRHGPIPRLLEGNYTEGTRLNFFSDPIVPEGHGAEH
jgi:hypothetical protein